MTVIDFQNVTKTFHRVVGQKLLRHYLEDLLGKSDPNPFYALKDVSFQIKDGESVAVVGSNGAGKSTLLSLVTGLVPPSSGKVAVKGRVAPLLELGAGFHPDLTGRENVILNASLLGLSRKQAARSFELIVEFAELQDFIEEPLRTYSEGMKLRLAFGVAVNLDPKILIIDEVLAVGDKSFQSKCMDRVFQLRNEGRTILCVSHDSETLKDLCSRAIWLDHGQVMMDGPIREVLDAYSGHIRAAHAAHE